MGTKSNTDHAIKYVDIGTLSSNFDLIHPSSSVTVDERGMFDMDWYSGAWSNVRRKIALKAGSSKHGNARRAYVTANCVEPIHLVN